MNNLKGLIIIFVPISIFLILVIIKSLDKNSFSLDAKQTLDMSLAQNHILSFKDLSAKLQTSKKMIIVDLNNNDEIKNGPLKNSLNIPFPEILNNKELQKYHSENFEIVLYSNSISESAKAWTILTQMDYMNLYILDISESLLISEESLLKDSFIESNEHLKYKFQPNLNAGLE